MKKARNISNLVPDLKKALSKATEHVARDVTIDLIDVGPYWTGQFSKAWEINVGGQDVQAVMSDASLSLERSKSPKPKLVFVPPAKGLEGYTIGNLMEYRLAAMDLAPPYPPTKRDLAINLTAKRDWFTDYMHGSRVVGTIKVATNKAMKEAGF